MAEGGLDCLVSEHFKFGLQTKLPLILSYLFTGCIRFGVLPTPFSEGLLVPIIKDQTWTQDYLIIIDQLQYLQSVPSYWSIISWISVVIFIMTAAGLDLLLIEIQIWLQH